ncbi:MAG: energy-coupled thiamine transporter ThiT [Lachnospiraceae bacterium]|nr:energy-coupled thiamine transporter ThiT [Lachnospiraceae bacterium]
MLYNVVVNDWGETTYVPTLAGKILLVILIVALLGLAVVLAGKHTGKRTLKLTSKQLAFCAMCLALGTLLSYVKLFHFPTGGSITLLSMLAVCLPGYWFGAGVGILTGVAYGILQMLIDPYILYPTQLVVDYILAFGALGLSGLFAKSDGSKVKNYIVSTGIGYIFAMLSGLFLFSNPIDSESSLNYNLLFAILFIILYVTVIVIGFVVKDNLIRGYTVAVVGRYAFAVLSGYLFFGTYAWDGWGALPYSLVYNAIYIFAEAAVTVVILLLPPVRKAMATIKRLACGE